MHPIKYASSIFCSGLKLRKTLHVIGNLGCERNLCNESLPTAFPPERNNSPFKFVTNKIDNLVKWYEEFTGLKDVRWAQQEVVNEREKLSILQEERRKAFSTLSEVQSKLKDVYAQLENTKRGDERYINLIREEHTLLKQEEAQQKKFRDAERSERDQFNIFSNTVRDSHAKERTQAEKTKYWSIIGSVIGAIIGIVGTSINNYFRTSELKNLVMDAIETKFQKEGQLHAENIEMLSNYALLFKNSSDTNDNSSKFLDDYIMKTNKLLVHLEQTMRKVESISNFDISKLQPIHSECKSSLLLTHFDTFAETIRRENEDLKRYILFAVVACAFLRILF